VFLRPIISNEIEGADTERFCDIRITLNDPKEFNSIPGYYCFSLFYLLSLWSLVQILLTHDRPFSCFQRVRNEKLQASFNNLSYLSVCVRSM